MNASGQQQLQLDFVDGILSIDPESWDRLARQSNAFVSHAWLAAMETAACASAEEGWLPQILTARLEGELVGAVPLYVKGHSYGEYVYDWAWADLAERMNVRYYPKLIAASPFSPVSGARILIAGGVDEGLREQLFDALALTTIEFTRQNQLGGAHFLFLPESDARRLGELGFLVRTAHQYHWQNDDYADFDAFLDRMRSKRRRTIRRERRLVEATGVHVEVRSGTDLTVEEMDAVFRFYGTTCDKYVWGRRYLNRAFFDEVHRTMPEAIRCFLAYDGDDLVAGTFNLVSGGRLYGRYWGCDVEIPNLHFECCYYAMIEYAIAEGLEAIEPGAGGEHKRSRGFEPVTTYSAHWLTDDRLQSILAPYLDRERIVIDETVERMRGDSVFKADEPSDDDPSA